MWQELLMAMKVKLFLQNIKPDIKPVKGIFYQITKDDGN
jgi:hypothetical protein